MAITLNMGVEGVSYQPSSVESRDDYPRHKVSLPIGASIPRHIENVFDVYANERSLADAVRPVQNSPSSPANPAAFSNPPVRCLRR